MQLGLGTWKLPNTRLIDYALQKGIDFIDTGDSYQFGISELRIGASSLKEKATICTKAGRNFYSNWTPWYKLPRKWMKDDDNIRGLWSDFRIDYLLFALSESLKRLRIDTLDVWYLHDPSEKVLLDQEYHTLVSHVKEKGLAKKVGVTCSRQTQFDVALWTGKFDVFQIPFNPEVTWGRRFFDRLYDRLVLNKIFGRGKFLDHKYEMIAGVKKTGIRFIVGMYTEQEIDENVKIYHEV